MKKLLFFWILTIFHTIFLSAYEKTIRKDRKQKIAMLTEKNDIVPEQNKILPKEKTEQIKSNRKQAALFYSAHKNPKLRQGLDRLCKEGKLGKRICRAHIPTESVKQPIEPIKTELTKTEPVNNPPKVEETKTTESTEIKTEQPPLEKPASIESSTDKAK